MAETQAAPSPAETPDVFNGENVSMSEYSKYREDGALPERFQAEDAPPAPADDQEEPDELEEEEEAAPDSAPEEPQELKAKTAKRIQQLLDETKELKRQLAEKQVAKPESTPAPEPQAAGEPTPEDKNADGSMKFKTYEAFTKALARWEIRQELAEQQREQRERTAKEALQTKLNEARERYDNADDVIFPANEAIQNARIPLAVKEIFAQSDVFVDLCYVVGSDPKALKDFISLAQTNPRAAIGKIYEYERGIHQELGKLVPAGETPARKTAAPKPPSPVGGGSTRAFDVSDESLSAEDWMRKRNKQLAARA